MGSLLILQVKKVSASASRYVTAQRVAVGDSYVDMTDSTHEDQDEVPVE